LPLVSMLWIWTTGMHSAFAGPSTPAGNRLVVEWEEG
jgi:hypothetical protein